MIQTFTCALASLEYGVASVTAPDQDESGDRHLVKTVPGGALLAVVDGSGHSCAGADPARLAVEVLKSHACEDLASLMCRCHERLKSTRGAVMGMAKISATGNTITWMGVGNIQGWILTTDGTAERMRPRPGIVGYRMPAPQPQVSILAPRDLIILTTDGIRPDFEQEVIPDDHPRAIADYISSRFRTGDDDGLVLVARYLGTSE